MRIQKVHTKQNPQFGTVFIKLKRADIPEGSGEKIRALLFTNVFMRKVSDTFLSGEASSLKGAFWKKEVTNNLVLDEITCRFTHSDPRKETNMAKEFENLMGDKVKITMASESELQKTNEFPDEDENWLS